MERLQFNDRVSLSSCIRWTISCQELAEILPHPLLRQKADSLTHPTR